jgi:hypothetical protein
MMVATILSGITAFPVETELRWLSRYFHLFPESVSVWLQQVLDGISATNEQYPFLAYGFDWLAFAHIVIALVFVGPLRDPVGNIWIIEWGMICCVLVFPLALIAGPIHEIPFFHQVIDCCFGLICLIPLYLTRKKIRQLAALKDSQSGVSP